MAFNPKEITREHIIQARDRIKTEQLSLKESTRWSVEIDGEYYPPKEIMRYAHQEMNGELIWSYGGGKDTNKWLQKYNFPIIDKARKDDPVLEVIERYKAHIRDSRLQYELYKWKLLKQFSGRPDVNADDFKHEFLSINFGNLIDEQRALASARFMAENKPEEFCDAFKLLFDANVDLPERIISFQDKCEEIHSSISDRPHRQDERTIATYLFFHNPTNYCLYKDSYYRKYCQLIGVEPKKKGGKFIHYLSLIDDFIKTYVVEDSELLKLKSELLDDECFEDLNHKLLAQDILYSTLDKQMGLGRNYWRIGTSNGNSNYWDVMYSNQYVSIGWPLIGDLSQKLIQKKGDIIQLLADNDYFSDNNVRSRKAGEIFDFYNKIQEGDIILAQDGATVLGVGEVIGDYEFDEFQKFPHYRQVEWRLFSPPIKNDKGLMTTVCKLSNPATINKVDVLLKNTSSVPINFQNDKTVPIMNQILYGPPGTGKTFNTINEALEICGLTTAALNRHEIKEKFEKLVNQGRIIFATFHQSMSYEDFVEGIKPVEPDKDGDPVIYRIEDGIFKRLCIEAAFALANKNESTTERVLDFSAAFDSLVGFLEERLVSEEEVTLTTKNGGKVLVDGISAKGSIIIKHPGKDNTYPISKERLSKLDQAFPDLSVVNNIDQQFRKIIGGSNSTANWSVLNAIRERNSQGQQINQTDNQYTWEDKVQVVGSMKNEDFNENTGEPYILIIDEINRGNVSQIFGELITLIEEDKRLGNSEAIRVQLPYSKDWFGVPPNLHIIGTMNTADRSVEALDTALRRRFSFTEMPPNPAIIKTEGKVENGLINGIDLSLLLMTINKRIEKLLDKDHMIGHSYFLNVADLPALKSVFHNKIVPLLQEYFFGDYGKIGLIIGTDFFDANDSVNEDFFAPFPDYDSSSLLDRTVYHLKNVMEMNDDHFLKALNVMLGKTTN